MPDSRANTEAPSLEHVANEKTLTCRSCRRRAGERARCDPTPMRDGPARIV